MNDHKYNIKNSILKEMHFYWILQKFERIKENKLIKVKNSTNIIKI